MKLNKEKGIILVLVIVIIGLLAVVGGVLLMRDSAEEQVESEEAVSNQYQYDASVVLDDPVTLQQKVDEIIAKAKEGRMALEMQVQANSVDGENFTCYLANSVENSYDMFFIIYDDATQEEIYRSGLIPLGGRIETFTTNRKLSAGRHTCTIKFVQVEEDLETIHAQVNVGLELIVN